MTLCAADLFGERKVPIQRVLFTAKVSDSLVGAGHRVNTQVTFGVLVFKLFCGPPHAEMGRCAGEGLYFNYLFLLVWIADVLFWWLRPERYETRPAWLEYGIHGYLFFIAFNGAVIFESGVTRIGGIVAVVIFAVIILRRQLTHR